MVDSSIETNATTSPITPSLSRDECSPYATGRFTTAISEADLARLHRKYGEQIACLEGQLQLKEALVTRYRQRVADQETMIATLTEQLLNARCSPPPSWDGESRAALVESMCEARLDRFCRRLRPTIVKINLSVGRLSEACQRLSEDTLRAELFLAIPSGPRPLDLIQDQDYNLADTLEYSEPSVMMVHTPELFAFHRSRQEIVPLSPLSKPTGDQPLSPQPCVYCEQMTLRVERLKQEVRKHRHFISGMKGVIQGLVQPCIISV